MVAKAAIGSYRRTAALTADGGRLVLMAYEGAIQALKEAEESLAAGDLAAKVGQVTRAQDFISELLAGINPEAGEVATNLRALYTYMLGRLVLVSPAAEERERYVHVRQMLEELYSAWKTIIEGPRLQEEPRRSLEEVAL